RRDARTASGAAQAARMDVPATAACGDRAPARGDGGLTVALLQLSEPGQSPDPHARRIAVGIDLGTTHSLVAAVRHGHAECMPDGSGQVLLPSVVRYRDDSGCDIGEAARAMQGEDPQY